MSTAQDLPAVVGNTPALHLAYPADESLPGGNLDFDGFVRRYESRLRRLVHRRLGDPGEAEEITQETLLRAYQHRHSFSAEDELIAWSTVVAQRLVIDRVRVRGRAVAVAEVPETYRVGRDTAEIVVARAEARTALEALESIPERQAAILWAREVEGLHYDDIAERFGITEPAVRSLLHRGRRALRKEYARRGGSLPLGGLIPLAPWLIALKKLGKVRTVARGPLKAVGPTATALALAGTVFVGIGGFGTDIHGSQPEAGLPSGTAHRSSFQMNIPRDPELHQANGLKPLGGGGGDGWSVLPDVQTHCVDSGDDSPTCFGRRPARGDVLYIGPEGSPVDRPYVSNYNIVEFCKTIPNTAVTHCESGNDPDTTKPATLPDPVPGAPR